MLIALLLLAGQQPTPQRFSILVPDQRCYDRRVDDQDVVVCAKATTDSQRLPFPDEATPTGPVASNPNLTGTAALAATGTPCAATQFGCQVGFGPPLVPIIKGLVGLVKDATAKKPDKRGRVPIDISEP
jgi:hypothetical protein